MSVRVDGASYPVRDAGGQTVFLPRGHHIVVIECAGPNPMVTAVKLAAP
jgi:hypothetical protein